MPRPPATDPVPATSAPPDPAPAASALTDPAPAALAPAALASAALASAHLGAELLAVTGALRRTVRRRLRAERGPQPPLRGAQLELLQLVESERGIGIAAAARSLHLADNSVSTLVNELVSGGWLRREVDPADRRAARLLLTDRARDRLASWRVARGELLGTVLDRLPAPERDAVRAVVPALRRLLTELEDTS